MVFAITAEDILMNIDKNMTAKTTWSSSRMIISTRRATRTLSSVNYSKGNDISYSEYTAPAKEKGTKMLKMKDNLWLYDPSTDRVIQISGNMLKQSVMGSDLSYEDFMDDLELLESYTAILDNDITYDNRKCYKLILTAKTSGLSYFKRILYVDKERMIPLYQELYAKSGIKLKTMKLSDVRKVGNRWYPMHIVFKDELKAGSGTTIINDDIEFNISIPDYYFSKAILKK
ncbi:MAG: outer membrane lipoprotein-sorting protein [Candidatus Cloacimonetes bacterium HGW-Cloacimonetes-1]|nr:MAG: outer membrane lipoprotein-sorting protein [Candidatus Cloacimonetes bacterium HGW-Cloacimonetes-1]